MTENELRINGKSFDETISQLEEFMESDDVHGELFTVLRSARDFMENMNEEIQQYRAYNEIFESHFSKEALELLRDKEEFGKWLERGKWIAKRCDEINRGLEQYRAIGTIEEFKALKEKNEAKKVVRQKGALNKYYHEEECPNCKAEFRVHVAGYKYTQAVGETHYCPNCGQKLDWQ